MSNLTPDDIEDGLRHLTDRQRQILAARCKGRTNKEIAPELNLAESSIKAEMSAIYQTLGMDDPSNPKKQERDLLLQVCPVYERVYVSKAGGANAGGGSSSGNTATGGGNIDQSGGNGGGSQEEPTKRGGETNRPPQPGGPTAMVPVPSAPNWLPWLLSAVLLVLLSGAAYLLLTRPASPGPQGLVVATPTAPQASPVFPARPATAGATVAVTTPQSSSTATNLIVDNFDNGLRPEWNVSSGQPIIAEGRVTAAVDNLTLEIGENLTRYTVEFDYDPVSSNGCCDPRRISLVLANKLRYDFSAYDSDWQELQQDKWVGIDHDGGLPPSGHFMLKVDPPHYTVFADKKKIREIIYGSPISGSLAISLLKTTYIDNFSLSSP